MGGRPADGGSRRQGGTGPAPAVRPLGAGDVGAVCAMLARAFHDDPVAAHLIPSERRRPGGLRAFFQLQITRDLLPHGGVFTTEDRSGAALWAPPGKPAPRGWHLLLGALPVLPYVAGRHFSRTLRTVAQIEAIHPRERHWYLATLGTEPSRQGQGIGSALLQPVLQRCDDEGVRAYLESSKPDNVPFYRRHGFEVTDEVCLGGGPVVWTMWRDPLPRD